ncbi:hypothetical protein QQS35_14800, partial [Aquibacillus sp. LR5S19]|nr:hypothetical protein [Aquibacillus sp. LR5S19]
VTEHIKKLYNHKKDYSIDAVFQRIKLNWRHSLKIQIDFLRAMYCCRSIPCPAGTANVLGWGE